MDKVPPALADRTFRFACDVVNLYRDLNRVPQFPYPLSKQFLRSGTSIGANVEEGKAGHSRKDLAAIQTTALKEARETKYWLRLFIATKLAPQVSLAAALKESDELCAILTVSVRHLRQPEDG
jgi:four helix bundle protein